MKKKMFKLEFCRGFEFDEDFAGVVIILCVICIIISIGGFMLATKSVVVKNDGVITSIDHADVVDDDKWYRIYDCTIDNVTEISFKVSMNDGVFEDFEVGDHVYLISYGFVYIMPVSSVVDDEGLLKTMNDVSNWNKISSIVAWVSMLICVIIVSACFIIWVYESFEIRVIKIKIDEEDLSSRAKSFAVDATSEI